MTELIASARDLRQRYRQAESGHARLRLLSAAGLALWEHGNTGSLWHTVLQQTLHSTAFDSGAIFSIQSGTLQVLASNGNHCPPVGTRLPAAGVLAAVLKPPARALMRSDITSSLSMKPVQVALELLVPLTLGGVIHGVLALNQQQSAPSPEADDLQTLQALAGMLASALADKNPDKAPLDHSGLDTLTAREQQVLALLPRGLTNAEMATELGVAAGTIKVHVERILFKLGLNDRTQAAVWASQRGLG